METILSTLFSPKKMKRIGFEDMLEIIARPDQYVILSTMGIYDQDCLIRGTLSAGQEESIVNEMLNRYTSVKTVVVYGRHSADDTVDKKYTQLTTLGIANVLVYSGGLFEWLLLQDIYGEKEFPTTTKSPDLLRYRCIKTV
jgi:hypothetical protein